tara:strand:+ start:2236 stop:2343 length:108 start_codon:yes stop_codon:yes gene_type:complete
VGTGFGRASEILVKSNIIIYKVELKKLKEEENNKN